jgi:FemAB-related protein (PEP-CTERM system-associated)
MSTAPECSHFEVRAATEQDRLAWDQYVAGCPEAAPYHLFAWKNAVRRAYGHDSYYLMAEDTGSRACLGVLPLIRFRLPWGRVSLISLPYCDYAGPLGTPAVRDALLKSCFKLADEGAVDSVEIRCPDDRQGFGDMVSSTGSTAGKACMILNLPESPEKLWGDFKSKLRSQINRPRKEGFVSRIGGCDLLTDFYDVFYANMKDLGSPVHCLPWFETLMINAGSPVRIGVVYRKSGVAVSAGFLMKLGSRAVVPWASSLREFNPHAPIMLLYWTFLSWACENGFDLFDFGRSTPGEGTYKFKAQWGANPCPLYWCTRRSGRKVIERSLSKDAQDPLRAVTQKLWARLPLPLANALCSRLRG